MPPTTGGNTSGSRISGRSTCVIRPPRRASTSAIGTPNNRHSAVLATAVRRLSSSAACDDVLALPVFPELTREQQDEVIRAVKDHLSAL